MFFLKKNQGKGKQLSIKQLSNFKTKLEPKKKKKTPFIQNSHNRELNQNPETKTNLYDKNKTI